MATPKEGQLNKKYYRDFGGGVNVYLGRRQIKDNESPEAINCDFIGAGGIKNREGFSELGTVGATYASGIYGQSKYKTSTKNQLIKFASDGSNVVLNYSTGGSWTAETGTKMTDSVDIDAMQASVAANTPYLIFVNGDNEVMNKFDGTTISAHTGGTKGFYPVYYAKRGWIVDETNLDTLNFSTEYNETHPLDFTDTADTTKSGTVTFRPGSGEIIVGMINFRGAMYVWLADAIYELKPSGTANTWTVTLITNSVGCVSFRSIDQVGDDVYFAADDGVYSLGEVANYTNIRTTNKSARVQAVFDAITSTNKKKLVGKYHNFKYHLLYSLGGSENDSCLVFDVRYNSWQDWRNMGGNDAVVWTNASDSIDLYFGHPSNGKVFKMYDTAKDDGTAITSTFYSKSFDEAMPDVTKLYFDSTFLFGQLGGTLTISVIFDDSITAVTKSLSQVSPQGGMGRTALGRYKMVPADSTTDGGGIGALYDPEDVTITYYVKRPLRIRAKGQKFAIQYKITSTGQWQLDSISQTFIPMSHFKFPSSLKIS